jgi:hypothetical protein
MSLSLRLILPGLLLGALISAPAAQAVTLIGTTSNPTGIDGLVVDGTTYNVTFVAGSYNTVYSGAPPTFFGNEPGAGDAATALTSALNTLDVQPTSPLGAFLVPYSNTAGLDAATYANYNGSNFSAADLTYETDTTNYSYLDYTSFVAVAAVPEPSTWMMLILGFAVLGFMTYRRKSKPALITA